MNISLRKLSIGAALLGICSLAAAQTSMAQQDAPPPSASGQNAAPGDHWRGHGGPERELEMLTNRLSLTPEQQSGVKAILDQQRSQMRALRNGPPPPDETPEARQAHIAQMKQIFEASNAKIAALLNDDQKKTFANWTVRREAEMARHQSREGNPPPSPAAPPQE